MTLQDYFQKKMQKQGVECHYNTSNTDFGQSHYFNFTRNLDSADFDRAYDTLKVRISDHSTGNVYRMSNEINIFSIEKADKVVDAIVRFFNDPSFCAVSVRRALHKL